MSTFKILFPFLFILLFSPTAVAGVEIELNLDNYSYVAGNTITAAIEVENTNENRLYLEFETLLRIGKKEYYTITEFEKIILEASEKKRITLEHKTSRNLETGFYEFILIVWNPPEKIFEKKTDVLIESSNQEEDDFIILVCNDRSCETNKKIFLQGYSVFMDIQNPENMTFDSILEFPDGLTKNINLPYSFTTLEVGTYTLNVKNEDSGQEKVVQFGVIENKNHAKDRKITDKINNSETSEAEEDITYTLLVVGGIVAMTLVLIMTALKIRK